MLSKFSVKKPYTVLVGVILILVMGVVSLMKMSADLLPDINLPYVVVLTTYVGASPETVETVVTAPVESAMATISNIEEITSMSAENYSVVILEFSQKTNMDSVTLDIRESLDQLESYWDDSVGNPIIMKLNPNMLPQMIAAVGVEGMSSAEVSKFVEEDIVPEIESIEGVAGVSTTGIIEESINVVISEDKVAKLNEKVGALIDEKFKEAYEEIEKGRKEIEDGEAELDEAEEELLKGEKQLNNAQAQVNNGKKELKDKQETTANELAQAKLKLLTAKADLESAKTGISTNLATLDALESTRGEVAGKRPELVSKKKELEKTLQQMNDMEDYLTVQIPNAISGIQAAFGLGAMTEDEANAKLLEIKMALSQTPVAAAFNALDFTVTNTMLVTQFNAIVSGYLGSAEYANGKAQLTNGIARIEAGIGEIDKGLENIDGQINNITMGMSTGDYRSAQNSALNQIAETTTTVDNGIVEVYQGETQAIIGFANGNTELSLADYKLSVSRAELEEGKTTIADARQQLEDAKKQLEEGKEQIDEAKEDAKKQADMAKILSVDTISGLLTAQNFSMPAGYVEEEGTSYLVRVGDKPADEEELKDMVILRLPMTEARSVKLSDVADVFTISNADEVYTNVNGQHGIILSIQKQTGYSTGDVSDSIKARFDELRNRYEGTDIIELMDQGIYIDLVMSTIFENVLLGGLLAVIVLIFFLRDIRPTLIIAISIPVSLIAAVVCMYFSGVTLNIISLSGLALGVGMLVDNSIVVIENIYRLRNNGHTATEAAIEGAKEVAGPIFASTLTTVCVFLPIVFTEGLTRQLFVDMGLTIAYSLMASLLVALTVVPACAKGMLRRIKPAKDRSEKKSYKAYEKFLRGALKVKWLVLLLVIVLLGLSAYAAYSRGMEYFPDMASTQVTVSVDLKEDSEAKDVKEETNILVERLAQVEDVVDIGAMASSTTLSLMGGTSSSADLTSTTIYVTTVEKRKHSSEELVKEFEACAADLENIDISVETSTMDMSALYGEGISLDIKGRDLDTLYRLAEEATGLLEAVPGVERVESSIEDASPELRVHVNKEKAAFKGLTVATVFMQVAEELKDPQVATKLSTATDDISVYVEDEKKSDLDRNDIKNMKITYTTDAGVEKTVKLKEIADFEDGVGMNTINRIGQTRYVSLTATIDSEHNVTFVSRDVETAMKKLNLPDGYSLEYTGENEMIMEAMRQLVLMLILSIIFIYLIMVAQFQSLGSPFIIMFTIPLAFTGGLGALYLTGSKLSIVAMIGFVMLSGVIVNNGIVLVDYINQRRNEGLSKKDAIVDAGATRLRPVLMTALTTILGLLMMAFSQKLGSDMSRPLAIVVIGGMLYGTLMTLVVVPCMYDIFMREKKNPSSVD